MVLLRPFVQCLSLVVLAIGTTGCYRWAEVAGDPQSALHTLAHEPTAIRLTAGNGQTMQFEKPLIRTDSILEQAERSHTTSRATPRDGVTKVEARRFSAGKTALAIMAIALAYPAAYIAYYSICGCYDL